MVKSVEEMNADEIYKQIKEISSISENDFKLLQYFEFHIDEYNLEKMILLVEKILELYHNENDDLTKYRLIYLAMTISKSSHNKECEKDVKNILKMSDKEILISIEKHEACVENKLKDSSDNDLLFETLQKIEKKIKSEEIKKILKNIKYDKAVYEIIRDTADKKFEINNINETNFIILSKLIKDTSYCIKDKDKLVKQLEKLKYIYEKENKKTRKSELLEARLKAVAKIKDLGEEIKKRKCQKGIIKCTSDVNILKEKLNSNQISEYLKKIEHCIETSRDIRNNSELQTFLKSLYDKQIQCSYEAIYLFVRMILWTPKIPKGILATYNKQLQELNVKYQNIKTHKYYKKDITTELRKFKQEAEKLSDYIKNELDTSSRSKLIEGMMFYNSNKPIKTYFVELFNDLNIKESSKYEKGPAEGVKFSQLKF